MGDFWWYSIMLFLACRSGDAIQAFIGLWLVPEYVGQQELGAVLPLANFAMVLGIPITVIVTTFSKQLTTFAAQGEFGKIKTMLRDVFICAGIFSVLTILLAHLLIPAVFERLRINKGSLGFVIIASTMVITISPIYSTALQALKKFNTLSLINVLSAPIRLATMLIAMPFRPLTGYFAGQAASPVFQIAASIFSLRKEFGKNIKAEQYLTPELKRSLLKYMTSIFTFQLSGAILGFISTLVIRQRLTIGDSAAYYMISRFSEVATFAGAAMIMVLFPLTVEASTRGNKSQKLLWYSVLCSIGFGILFAAGLYFAGDVIFSYIPNGEFYIPYMPQMLWFTVIGSVGIAYSCIINFEMANSRFGFLFYYVPHSIMEAAILVCFTGITFFTGILPDSIISRIQSLQPCSLNFFLSITTISAIIRFACSGIHLYFRNKKSRC